MENMMSARRNNHALNSGDGHSDSTPHSFAAIHFRDASNHEGTPVSRGEFLSALQDLRDMHSAVGFTVDSVQDPTLSVKHEHGNITLQFKIAEREITIELGSLAAFNTLSTRASLTDITRQEKHSKAGEHLHHRVRTKGAELSTQAANKLGQLIQLRFS
jgi:hypothetical protein